MKNILNFNKIGFIILTLVLGLFQVSCSKYLDKAPGASINELDMYKDFKSFQGFTEGLYVLITDPSKHQLASDLNLADEGVCNVTFSASYYMDAGDYVSWWAYGPFGRIGTDILGSTDCTDPKSYIKGYWPCSWTGIRKANLGLANLDKLVNATQEEKDLIKGQLLFFRGYYYLQLINNWGGMPYLTKALSPTDEMKFPRLNYRETALKASADLDSAATLLPVNWDALQAGQKTLGDNRQRINKIMALSFSGKCLLYAASPLMNKESTGKAGYDQDLCKKAADRFAQVINLCNTTSMYSLQPLATYSDMFFNAGLSPSPQEGGVEVIFNCPTYQNTNHVNTSLNILVNLGGGSLHFSPSANYVEYFGMSNGYPIDDPASGYDPTDPWKNRDPRFYKTIMIDGERLCNSSAAGADQYIALKNGGRHRTPASAGMSYTGYDVKKFTTIFCNKFDKIWGADLTRYINTPPLMRLADVYYMYAEAVYQGYGDANTSAPGSTLTAVAAVNLVRARSGMLDVPSKFITPPTADLKTGFMGQIILERAVELAFEGERWYDLRRWLLAGDQKYLAKTDLAFDRAPGTGTSTVPTRPINIQKKTIRTRVFADKNYWMPIPNDYVTLYPSFNQNPGY